MRSDAKGIAATVLVVAVGSVFYGLLFAAAWGALAWAWSVLS